MRKELYKSLILIMALTLIGMSGNCQPLTPNLGASIGYNTPSDYQGEGEATGDMYFAFSSGWAYKVNDKLALDLGVSYMNIGMQTTIDNQEFSWKLNQIGIPINANYLLSEQMSIKGGLLPGVYINPKIDESRINDHPKYVVHGVIGVQFLAVKHVYLDASVSLNLVKMLSESSYVGSTGGITTRPKQLNITIPSFSIYFK